MVFLVRYSRGKQKALQGVHRALILLDELSKSNIYKQTDQKSSQKADMILYLFKAFTKQGGFEMARILLVDDAKFMRKMLRDIITKAGHEVVAEAGNGEEAIEQYRLYNPDVVLSDITMPVMDGLKSLKVIMTMDANAKVIICSAMGQQAMVIEALKLGAKDFLVKPFQGSRVISAIETVSSK